MCNSNGLLVGLDNASLQLQFSSSITIWQHILNLLMESLNIYCNRVTCTSDMLSREITVFVLNLEFADGVNEIIHQLQYLSRITYHSHEVVCVCVYICQVKWIIFKIKLLSICQLSLKLCAKFDGSLLTLKGSVKEPNMFHKYETEKINRKASDAAKYIELFGSSTRDHHARRI